MANAYNARQREDERRRRQQQQAEQQAAQQNASRSTGSVSSPRTAPTASRQEPLSGLFNTLGLGNRNNTQNNGSTRMGYGALAGSSASADSSSAPLKDRTDLMAPVWKSLGIDAKKRDEEKKRRADLEQESSASEAAAYSARRKADREQDNAYAEASAYSAQRKQEEEVSPRDARRAEREAAQARQDAVDAWLEEQETIRRAGMEKEWAKEDAQAQADKEANKAIQMNAEQEGSASEAAAYSAARNNAMTSQREAAAKAADAQTAKTPEEAARRLADGKYLSFDESVLAAQDPDVQEAARRAGAPSPARYVQAQQYYTAQEDLEKLRTEHAELMARSNAYYATRQGEWSAEDEARLMELEGSLIPSLESTVKNFEADVDFMREIGSNFSTGFLDATGHNITRILDWLGGENSIPYKIFTAGAAPKGANFLTEMNKAQQAWLDYRRNSSYSRTYGNDLGREIAQHADSIGASAPFIVINLMSLPLAAAGTATTAGLNYASSLAQSSGLQAFQQMAMQGLKTFGSNHAAQYSMASTFGPSYEDALKEGATPVEATLYATVNSVYNAMIEVGGADEAAGGMEALPKQIADAMKNGEGFKEAAMDYVKSIVGEVGEEELQRFFEEGLKSTYQDVSWLDQSNPNSVLNVGSILDTAKNTTIETAIMGSAQTAGQYAYQGASNIVNGGPTAINQQEAVRAAAREAGIELNDQQIADVVGQLNDGTRIDFALANVLGIDLGRNESTTARPSGAGENVATPDGGNRSTAGTSQPEAPARPSGAGMNQTVADGGDRAQTVASLTEMLMNETDPAKAANIRNVLDVLDPEGKGERDALSQSSSTDAATQALNEMREQTDDPETQQRIDELLDSFTIRNTHGEERAEALERENERRRTERANALADGLSEYGDFDITPRSMSGEERAEAHAPNAPRTSDQAQTEEVETEDEKNRRIDETLASLTPGNRTTQETAQVSTESQNAQVDESVPEGTQKSTEGESRVFNAEPESEETSTERKNAQVSTEETLNQLGLGNRSYQEIKTEERRKAEAAERARSEARKAERTKQQAKSTEQKAEEARQDYLDALANEGKATREFSSPEVQALAETFADDYREAERYAKGEDEFAEIPAEERAETLNEIFRGAEYYVNIDGEVVRARNSVESEEERKAREREELTRLLDSEEGRESEADSLARPRKISFREEPSEREGRRVPSELLEEARRQEGWKPDNEAKKPSYKISGPKPGDNSGIAPSRLQNGSQAATMEKTKGDAENERVQAEAGRARLQASKGADGRRGDQTLGRSDGNDGRGTDADIRRPRAYSGTGIEEAHAFRASELEADGARLYAESEIPADIRPAVEAIRKIDPGCPVTVLENGKFGAGYRAEISGASAGIFLDAEEMRKAAKADNVTLTQIALHELGHHLLLQKPKSVSSLRKALKTECLSDTKLKRALNYAFKRHKTSIHANDNLDTDGFLEEVFCDLFSDNPRAFRKHGKVLPGYETARRLVSDYFDAHLVPGNTQHGSSSGARQYGQNKAENPGDADVPFTFGSEDIPHASELRGEARTSRAQESASMEQALNERDRQADNAKRIAEARKLLEESGYQVSESNSDDDMPFTMGESQQAKETVEPAPAYDPSADIGGDQVRELGETASRLTEAYHNSALVESVIGATADEASHKSRLRPAYAEAVENVLNAPERLASGEITPTQMFDAYEALGDEENLSDTFFHDEKVQKAIDAFKKLAERKAQLPAGMRLDAKTEKAYRKAFTKATKMMECSLTRSIASLSRRVSINEEVSRNGKANTGSKASRIGGTYLKSMARPDVMIKDWGGCDQKASAETYRLAEQHNESIIRKINVAMEAHQYFDSVMGNAKARDFANGKTKCGVTGWSENLSLGVLKILEDKDGIDHIVNGALYIPANEASYYRRVGDNSALGSNEGAFMKIDYTASHEEEARENMTKRSRLEKGEKPSWTQIQEEAKRLATVELEELRDQLHSYFSGSGVGGQFYKASLSMMEYAAGEMNSVSRRTIGIDIAEDGKNHWSLMICGDGGSLSSKALAPSALEDMRIVQERTGPAGGIRAVPFTEAASSYISQFSDYVAFRELASDLELMDTRFFGARGVNTDTLSSTVSKLDQYNAKWLKDYVADLNNQRSAKDDVANSILRTLRGNLAQSALLLNPGVAIKQTPSYLGYAGEIPMKYLTKHLYGMLMPASYFSNNKTVQGVDGSTNMLRSRRSGWNIVEMGEAMDSDKGLFKQVMDRLPSGLNWINMMDYRTVANGLMATADWVADTTDNEPGTQKFYDEVAKRFERATLLTNPIYTKQARSALQRSTNEVVRSLSMFKTQPIQYANQLYLAAKEYDAAMASSQYTQSEKKAASKKLRETTAGVVAANALFALMGTAVKLAMHKKKDLTDEDGNVDWYKVLALANMGFIESMGSMLWFGDYASAALIDTAFGVANKVTGGKIPTTHEFYGVSEGTTNLVNNAIEAMMNVTTNPTLKNAKAAATSLASALGLPLGNVYNMMNAVFMHTMDTTGNNPRHVDDAVSLVSQYYGKSDEEKAKYTVEHAMELMRHNRADAATALMVSLGEKGFEKQVANAITKAYAEGKIDDVIALNWMKNYAGKSDEDAEKALNKAKVDYEYGKIKTEFEGGLDADGVFESLGISVPRKEHDAATETIESYLKDQKKREIAKDLGVEYSSDFDKTSELDDPLAFLGFKNVYLTAEKSGDWDTIDDLIKGTGPYAKLSDAAKELLDNSARYANEVFDAASYGISAKEWYWVHDKYKEIRDGEGNATDKAEAFKTWLSHTAFTSAQKNLLIDQMGYQTVLTANTDTYDKLTATGLSPEMAQYYSGLKRGNDAGNESEILSTILNGKGSQSEKEKALLIYLSDNQYQRYERAMEAGVGPKNWAKFMDAAKQAHVQRTGSNSGSLSKADIEAACEAMGWNTSADKKQMWAVYKGS